MYTYSIATVDDIRILLNKWEKVRGAESNYKRYLDMYFNDYISGRSIFFVVKDDLNPVGSIILEFCELDDISVSYVSKEKYCFLSTFKIEKPYEGHGHISKLTKMAENVASKMGYTYAIISVEESNQRAKSIYTHFGYKEVISHKQEYGRNIIFLGKKLRRKNRIIKKHPYVSIVVPVYNSLKYISETTNCILHQTFTNFELIFVDDGSSDLTSKFIYEAIQQDKRIKIIQQKHLGAGIARNNGLKAATGKYIIFLDSDDLFLPNMLEKLVKTADTYKTDIVTFGFFSFKNEPSNYIPTPCLYDDFEERLYSSYELKKCIFQKTVAAAWNKFFKRSYLIRHEIKFQGLPFFNDEFFSRIALLQSERIFYIKESLLFYRLNSAQNIHSAKDGSTLFSRVVEAIYFAMDKSNLLFTFKESFSAYFAEVIFRALSHATTNETFSAILEECNGLFDKCKSGVCLTCLNKEERDLLEYVLSGDTKLCQSYINQLLNIRLRNKQINNYI